MVKDTLTLSVDQSGFDHHASALPMRNRLFPIISPLKKILLPIIAFGYLGSIYLGTIYQTSAYNWMGYIALVAALLFLAIAIFQQRKIWQAVSQTPSRSDTQTLTLDAEKMSVRHPGFYAEIHWSHVVDVIQWKDGLLVLIGALEAQPIPLKAIPQGMSQTELKNQISCWINAAKT